MASPHQHSDEIVTEIVMSQDGIPWLAVEGDTDERFFRSRNFRCRVKIVVAVGWEGVREVLVKAGRERHAAIVVGVIDRDYRDHSNTQPVVERLVLTDRRDIEGMMFWSVGFHRVFDECGSREKMPKDERKAIDYGDMRRVIARECEVMGRFRAHCFLSGKAVSFKDLDYLKFVDDRTLRIDVEDFLSHLRGRNSGSVTISDSDWDAAQAGPHLHGDFRDPAWVCHGHDLMAFVAISLRRMWGSKGGALSREDVESMFRLSFSDGELAATTMWGEIIDNLAP